MDLRCTGFSQGVGSCTKVGHADLRCSGFNSCCIGVQLVWESYLRCSVWIWDAGILFEVQGAELGCGVWI